MLPNQDTRRMRQRMSLANGLAIKPFCGSQGPAQRFIRVNVHCPSFLGVSLVKRSSAIQGCDHPAAAGRHLRKAIGQCHLRHVLANHEARDVPRMAPDHWGCG
jgi:hypothetical protein